MARKHNIIVIGNGLFGSIAATLCRAHGHTVTVVSDDQPYAGSGASGCVLAPSWLASLDKDQIADAMTVLRELYTVYDLEFKTNLLKTFKAQRVSPEEVLVKADIVGRAELSGKGQVIVQNGMDKPETLRGKVLVAAGVWTPNLVQGMPPMRSLWGASLIVKAQMEAPRIHVYAPYRQAVAFNLDKRRVWMGDGTALVSSTWDKEARERVQKTTARASELFGLPVNKATHNIGARPYVEGHKAGFFAQVDSNVWVSTGGAKNGTVLAALQALQFLRVLGAVS
jgi:glycine/D-amino acid oxidase-like deaminating enzyme